MSKKATKSKIEVNEPAIRSRWALTFDAALNIDTFLVQNISPIVYDANKGEWKRVQIDFIETVEKHVFMNLVQGFKYSDVRKPIVLQFFDGPGNNGKTIVFDTYNVVEIGQEGLSYSNNEILMSHLIIEPIKVTFENKK